MLFSFVLNFKVKQLAISLASPAISGRFYRVIVPQDMERLNPPSGRCWAKMRFKVRGHRPKSYGGGVAMRTAFTTPSTALQFRSADREILNATALVLDQDSGDDPDGHTANTGTYGAP